MEEMLFDISYFLNLVRTNPLIVGIFVAILSSFLTGLSFYLFDVRKSKRIEKSTIKNLTKLVINGLEMINKEIDRFLHYHDKHKVYPNFRPFDNVPIKRVVEVVYKLLYMPIVNDTQKMLFEVIAKIQGFGSRSSEYDEAGYTKSVEYYTDAKELFIKCIKELNNN